MRHARILPIAFILASCTYAALSPAGARVRPVLREPGPECENLGVVTGKGGGGGGAFVANESLIEYATNDALNKAADRGATHLALTSPGLGTLGDRSGTTTATLMGIAYRCPDGAVPATAAAAPQVPAPPPPATAAKQPAATEASAIPSGYTRLRVVRPAAVRTGPDVAAPETFRLAPGTVVWAADDAIRGFRRIRANDDRGQFAGFVEAGALAAP